MSASQTVGLLLLLAAFASGCSALTGIEAIANATPSFREPRRTRARTAEAGLGIVLGALLLGLAALVQRFDAQPVDGRTLLSVLAEGSIGTGWGYVVVQLSTTLLLALAANTSFGGLPVLAARVAADGALPHVFGLRGDRQVYPTSIIVLTVLSAVLLVASAGQVNVLVPLFAIGVFVGFTLCQAGMLRHWWTDRRPGWRPRAALNGFGAALTAIAAAVLTVEKFTEGAWLVVLVIPLMVAGFRTVRRTYARIGRVLEVDARPQRPRVEASVVVVPIVGITRLAEESLSAALSLGDRVVGLHVVLGDEADDRAAAADLQRRWDDWQPDVTLAVVTGIDEQGRPSRVLGPAIAQYVRNLIESGDERVVLLIGEVAHDRWWEKALFNRRGAVVAAMWADRPMGQLAAGAAEHSSCPDPRAAIGGRCRRARADGPIWLKQ